MTGSSTINGKKNCNMVKLQPAGRESQGHFTACCNKVLQ